MLKGAEFIRVSTEEQARHGYSLEAQRAALDDYARRNDIDIVDRYIDEGVSARIPYHKRPEFMRLIRDVEAGKIKYIFFIKLDRWFRNVKEYYKVQEILDAHHVNWRSITEDYDTETATGKLNLNIMLSLAQNEADRTSERIKFVFQDKVRRGQSYTAALPIGYRLDGQKHIVFDEPPAVDLARDIFQHYDSHGSIRGTTLYMHQKYGRMHCTAAVRQMLTNRVYLGEFAGVPGFHEPIIGQELFGRVQGKLSRNIRFPQSKRTYIFASMLRCPECGHVLGGRTEKRAYGKETYLYYRCSHRYNSGLCSNGRLISEAQLEEYLLASVRGMMRAYVGKCKAEAEKQKPTIDKGKILRKLARLKDLYVNELISMDDYRKDYDLLQAQLQEADALERPVVTDTSVIEALLDTDFESLYASMTRESRQAFWHGTIAEIHFDNNNNVSDVIFL